MQSLLKGSSSDIAVFKPIVSYSTINGCPTLFCRERNEIYKGARSFPVEKHIMFYQVSDDGIDVARILHQHMDLSKHF